jgi:hypothetical protein
MRDFGWQQERELVAPYKNLAKEAFSEGDRRLIESVRDRVRFKAGRIPGDEDPAKIKAIFYGLGINIDFDPIYPDSNFEGSKLGMEDIFGPIGYEIVLNRENWLKLKNIKLR